MFTVHYPFFFLADHIVCSLNLEFMKARMSFFFFFYILATVECLNDNQFTMLNVAPFGFQSIKRG